MAAPLVVLLTHQLGKDEAIQRLKCGLEDIQKKPGQLFAIQDPVWAGDRMQFRISAIGQTATGTIDVTDDQARIEVNLPWLLARAADTIRQEVRKQGTAMLG